MRFCFSGTLQVGRLTAISILLFDQNMCKKIRPDEQHKKMGRLFKEPLQNSLLISFCYMMAKYLTRSAPNNPSMDSGAAAASVLPAH
jgi:hypothetical protein